MSFFCSSLHTQSLAHHLCLVFSEQMTNSPWLRDYNFLPMYTQSSGPNLRAPCTYSESLCDRSFKGLRGLQGDNRGIWSQMWVCRRHLGSWECCHSWNWAPLLAKLGPMITNCKSHLVFASLSAPLLLPAIDRAKHFLSWHCTPFVSVFYTCRHIESFTHNCWVVKAFCLHYRLKKKKIPVYTFVCWTAWLAVFWDFQ